MGLEKVKERVLEEARQKAKSRIDAANSEALKILKSFSGQAKEKENAFRKQLASEVELIKKGKEAAAKLEAKKLALTFRKNFIDEIFSLAQERASNLPDSKKSEHIKKLLKKAGSEIDTAVVYCSKKDRKFVNNLEVIESDMLGGIIAESPDRTLRVDYSYETLLGQLKDSLLPELNRMLFSRKK